MTIKSLIIILIIISLIPIMLNLKNEFIQNEVVNITGKKVVMIVAPEDFRDEELFETKKVLENSGAKITIASKDVKEATGVLGGSIKVDLNISEVNEKGYDAVVFVGGAGASVYFDDDDALRIAKEFNKSNKVVSAICIAPSILANAGILKGKNATCFSSEKENLESKGAKYTGKSVEVDGKIVTANGPKAASEFGKEIAKKLT